MKAPRVRRGEARRLRDEDEAARVIKTFREALDEAGRRLHLEEVPPNEEAARAAKDLWDALDEAYLRLHPEEPPRDQGPAAH